MNRRIYILSTLAIVVTGCASQIEHECSSSSVTLSEVEKRDLEEVQMNNEFISGCVTEKISEFCEELCQGQSNQCENEQNLPINYSQWLNIYEACIAK